MFYKLINYYLIKEDTYYIQKVCLLKELKKIQDI